MKILLNILSFLNIKFLLGFIENTAFPPSLKKEEEERLIKELSISDKAKAAREKLIVHNLRLVGHIAKKYESRMYEYDDLISIGTLGLIKGIDTFDVNKDVRLATYISRCIENEILMHLRANKKRNRTLPFSDTVSIDKEGEEIPLQDVIDIKEASTEEKYDKKEAILALKKYLNILDELEYKIITMRYGLNNTKEYKQKEIGKIYHISRSYVSRIEKRALIKLYTAFKEDH